MRTCTFDNPTDNALDCALIFKEDDKIVGELCTSCPNLHQRLQNDWVNGKLSWNQLQHALVHSDEYEGRSVD